MTKYIQDPHEVDGARRAKGEVCQLNDALPSLLPPPPPILCADPTSETSGDSADQPVPEQSRWL